ncbi:hypothetical protein [Cellulosimicrobium sp. TH-20]|uniref:hypothetical protein n=1 Tax=Cellulosimicrobium sp. TH-20 TaxID=1980001 RepID=UPI0011A4A684|nr:hypothetical protein [Cellulosimicrobium sp. TH-20]
MTFPHNGPRPLVFRLRPGTRTNGFGDVVEDWSTPERTRLHGAIVQDSNSVELPEGSRVRVVTRKTLFARGAPGLRATDRVEVDGEVFLVDGEPVVRRPRSRPVYTTADLKRPTG